MEHLYAALAAFNAKLETIVKDRTVTVRPRDQAKRPYSFRYAQLETILAAIRKPLAEAGLSLVQRIVKVPEGDAIETTLAHTGGESISNLVRMIVLDNGPQAYGSAQMYARRQGVTLLLCLAAEDDDDANEAEGNEVTVQRADSEDPAPPGDGKAALLPVDPELVEQYAKRIIQTLDNQDPGGAVLLYLELSDEEKEILWRKGGLTMKQKQVIRGAVKTAAAHIAERPHE
jgi:ERF superfamily